MNSSWMRSQDRRRNLIAGASTACLYALAFVGAWLIGSLAPVSLASVPGTVIVDLGGNEGPPGETPQGLESAPDRPADAPPGAAPLPAAAAQAATPAVTPASKVAPIPEPPATPVPKVPPIAAPAIPPSTAPKAVKAATPKVPAPSAAAIAAKDAAAAKAAAQDAAAAQAAQARAAQEDAALRAAAASAAAPPAPPKTRTFGSSTSTGTASAGAPVAPGGTGTGSEPGIAGGTGSVTFRGSEMGSALATTFGASSGQVGRTLYEPIWMYMPLPKVIGDSVYRNIAAKETFRSFYRQAGSEWQLRAQVPLAQRSDVWNMLDSAGFDASTADFKTASKLSQVVLEFIVGPLTKGKVELVDVRLISSSGSSEVDEAVIYGFRRGAYFNKTGNAVVGRFDYSF